jgi:hypothetical protein
MGKTNRNGNYKSIGRPLKVSPQSIGQRDVDAQPGQGIFITEPDTPETREKRPGSGIGGRHVAGKGIGTGFNDAWKGQPPEHSDANRVTNEAWADKETEPINWSVAEAIDRPSDSWKSETDGDWVGSNYDINAIIAREIARSTSADDE